MLTNITFNLLGVLIFLFIFWKKLKEDYFPALIFSTAFYMLAGALLGFAVSYFLFKSYWFWLAFGGACLGALLGILRLHLKPYETIEAGVASLLPWFGLIFFADAAQTSAPTSFVAGLVVFCLIALYVFLDRHYKNFTWYSSGRIGFSGLTTLAVFFLLRACLAIFAPSVLSFVKVETLISGFLAFVLTLSVFKLSREKL